MRELKFRAWDKVAKKFLHPWPDGFDILGETTCFDMIGQQLGEREPRGNILGKLNDVVITQYTGLKDSKGVEIYEGGIIIADNLSKPSEVGYAMCCAFLASGASIYVYKNVKIIGNIHENKDLISG